MAYQCNLIKNSTINARIDAGLKKDVERVFNRLGLTMSEAITLYLSQVKLTNGIPFAIKIPNETTLKVFEETDKNKNVTKAKNIREIFEKVDF
ncbi:MAG: type II toxin-antitoxin system RelB/DinJ family antitoxin [bacterium]